MTLPFALLLGGIFFVYTFWIETSFLGITRHKVIIPGEKLVKPVRILFVSDFHLGFFNRGGIIRNDVVRFKAIHAKEPFDLICFGGDYLDSNPKYLYVLERVLDFFVTLNLPMVAILGNHDHEAFPSIETLRNVIERKGVTVLANEAKAFECNGQSVVILGLEDLEEHGAYRPGGRRLKAHESARVAERLSWLNDFDTLAANFPRVLLSHNPDGSRLPAVREPDLVLSGHTHGGQYLPLRWLAPYFWLYLIMPAGSFLGWAGRTRVGDRELIVSRGLGSSAVPSRFLMPPGAEIITLISSTDL